MFSYSRKLAANMRSTLIRSIKVPVSGDSPPENLTCCELDRESLFLSCSWDIPLGGKDLDPPSPL